MEYNIQYTVSATQGKLEDQHKHTFCRIFNPKRGVYKEMPDLNAAQICMYGLFVRTLGCTFIYNFFVFNFFVSLVC